MTKRSAWFLQAGGALGGYQAGVYEALLASEHLPDWVAGISIGAINAAIIAGNTPGLRHLRQGSMAYQKKVVPATIALSRILSPSWFSDVVATYSACRLTHLVSL